MSPQELIQKAHTITIAQAQHAQSSSFKDAFALFYVLSKLGKNVRFEENANIPPSFEWLTTSSFPTQTAILSIREIAPLVSKISYEKSGRDVQFSFALLKGNIDLQSIEVEKPLDPDLTIVVGQENHEQEITFNPHPRFWNGKRALQIAIESLSPLQIPLARLFEQTLSLIEYTANKKVCLFAFDKKVFRETQTNPKDALRVVEELAKWGQSHISYVVFLEAKGILWSPQKDLREKIAKHMGATIKGNWTLFGLPSKDATKNKEKILSLL